MDNYRCFVSVALTINTISSFFSLDSYKKKDIIASRDLSGYGGKLLNHFDTYWLPAIKRFTFFEIGLCIFLISYFHDKVPAFYNDWSKFLLYLPQILYLFFLLLIEFVVFFYLCIKSSYKNNRPYWIGTVEFVFIFIVFGILDLILPPVFDVVSRKAFQSIKDIEELSPETKSSGSDLNI